MEHTNRSHALLSASGASRWLNCTPSARLEENIPDRVSPFAAEGTLAHEISELKLRIFKEGATEKSKGLLSELKKMRKNELYSPDMDDEVDKYVDYVKEIIKQLNTEKKDYNFLIEERLDFSNIVEKGYGTGDVCIISDNLLRVIDLKYGKGVVVEAENNPQLMLYGIGALNKYSLHYDISEVELTIFQPRLDHLSSFRISVEELIKWGDDIVKPKAQLAYSGDGEKKAGEWCKFCKVKALCKTLAEENMKLAKYEFAQPDLLTIDELVEIYKQQPVLLDWVNSVADYLLDQALKGGNIKGYKIVEGRSMRKWVNEQSVAIKLSKIYPPERYLISKLDTLTNIEKLVGKKEFDSIFRQDVIKPPGKPTLVPNSDKRPALGTEQAKIDFK